MIGPMASKRISLWAASLVAGSWIGVGGVARSIAQEPTAAKPRIADGFSTDWEHLTIDVRELAPGVYLLHGSGGNTLA
jgi:cyclase